MFFFFFFKQKTAYEIDPPSLIRIASFRILRDVAENALAAPQKRAQDGVGESLGGRALQLTRHPHSAVDHGMGWRRRVDQLVESHPQKRLDVLIGERALRKDPCGRADLPKKAKRAVREVGRESAFSRLRCARFLERTP